MDLRDYFAAAALTGILAGEAHKACANEREMASAAYNIAENMLIEREHRRP